MSLICTTFYLCGQPLIVTEKNPKNAQIQKSVQVMLLHKLFESHFSFQNNQTQISDLRSIYLTDQITLLPSLSYHVKYNSLSLVCTVSVHK